MSKRNECSPLHHAAEQTSKFKHKLPGGAIDRQGMVVGGEWGVLILDTRGQAEASEEFREQTVARGSVREETSTG